jgi:hypothetical protein
MISAARVWLYDRLEWVARANRPVKRRLVAEQRRSSVLRIEEMIEDPIGDWMIFLWVAFTETMPVQERERGSDRASRKERDIVLTNRARHEPRQRIAPQVIEQLDLRTFVVILYAWVCLRADFEVRLAERGICVQTKRERQRRIGAELRSLKCFLRDCCVGLYLIR